MPNKKKPAVGDLLQSKSPSTLRQPVNPVDILEAATKQKVEQQEQMQQPSEIIEQTIGAEKPNDQISGEVRSEKAIEKSIDKDKSENQEKKTVRKGRAENRHQRNGVAKRAGKPRLYSERDIHALFAVDKRQTERYSFEIYTDQKEDIQLVCDLYEAETGRKLSASRLIREVLDSFLPSALKALQKDDEESRS